MTEFLCFCVIRSAFRDDCIAADVPCCVNTPCTDCFVDRNIFEYRERCRRFRMIQLIECDFSERCNRFTVRIADQAYFRIDRTDTWFRKRFRHAGINISESRFDRLCALYVRHLHHRGIECQNLLCCCDFFAADLNSFFVFCRLIRSESNFSVKRRNTCVCFPGFQVDNHRIMQFCQICRIVNFSNQTDRVLTRSD